MNQPINVEALKNEFPSSRHVDPLQYPSIPPIFEIPSFRGHSLAKEIEQPLYESLHGQIIKLTWRPSWTHYPDFKMSLPSFVV